MISKLSRFRTELLPTGIVAVGVVIRLVAAATAGTLVDEPVYRYAGAYTLAHGFPAIRPSAGQHVHPFLYHPPFFFYLLAGWFALWGSTTMFVARSFSVFASGIALVLLYVLARYLLSANSAVVFLGLIALDPWLVLTNQAVYLENVLMVLIALAVLAYARALRRNRTGSSGSVDFVVAGLAIGSVVVFKQIGGYLLLMPLINLALTRGRNARGHMYLFATAGFTLLVYLLAMHLIFGSQFDQTTLTQLRRTLGLRHSPGLNYGPLTAMKAVIRTYWIFVASVATLALGSVTALVETVRRLRARDREDAVILSWALGGLVFAAAIALKSPHYVILWLVPFYLLVTQHLPEYLARARSWTALFLSNSVRRRCIAAAATALVVINLWSLQTRFLRGTSDPISLAVAYANGHVSRGAIVAAPNYIGTDIDQPYVPMRTTARELYDERARWFIGYWSLTEPLPKSLGNVNSYCVQRRVFQGFDDHAEVCRLVPELMLASDPPPEMPSRTYGGPKWLERPN